jgi:hypothetical protein
VRAACVRACVWTVTVWTVTVHRYVGVYGAHVAMVLRRLLRLCAHYGSAPRFIACSATLSAPRRHFELLLPRPAVLAARALASAARQRRRRRRCEEEQPEEATAEAETAGAETAGAETAEHRRGALDSPPAERWRTVLVTEDGAPAPETCLALWQPSLVGGGGSRASPPAAAPSSPGAAAGGGGGGGSAAAAASPSAAAAAECAEPHTERVGRFEGSLRQVKQELGADEAEMTTMDSSGEVTIGSAASRGADSPRFCDTNRRDIGKSQSIWTDSNRGVDAEADGHRAAGGGGASASASEDSGWLDVGQALAASAHRNVLRPRRQEAPSTARANTTAAAAAELGAGGLAAAARPSCQSCAAGCTSICSSSSSSPGLVGGTLGRGAAAAVKHTPPSPLQPMRARRAAAATKADAATVVAPRRWSSNAEASAVLAAVLSAGARALCFTRVRRMCEILRGYTGRWPADLIPHAAVPTWWEAPRRRASQGFDVCEGCAHVRPVRSVQWVCWRRAEIVRVMAVGCAGRFQLGIGPY